ncbi:hypothetical protein [Thalassoglobus neptunius]|uniref:hypothetical protein n=1 Tax=Thalassoglobus neptunius TaxID=1938619 RepID=UPI0011B7EB43|nr:hypothetical protein [Thalassoglobus neptunius]
MTDFRDARTAITSVLELLSENVSTDQAEDVPALRIAMHRGAIVKTITDGRSDYAGRTVNAVSALIESNVKEKLVLTDELFSDSEIQDLLAESGFVARKLEVAPVSGSAVFEVTQMTSGQSTISEP